MNTSDWNEKPEDSQPKKVFQKSTRTKLRTRIGFTETASKVHVLRYVSYPHKKVRSKKARSEEKRHGNSIHQ